MPKSNRPNKRNHSQPPPRRKRAAAAAAAAAASTTLELKHVIHELEVYQEEIRIQNQQLIESQRLLEESRDRYADLYDLAPVAYVTLCPNGVIREINRGGAELLSIPRSRALESPMVLFIAPASRRAFLSHMQRCRAGAAPVVSELALITRDGRRIDIEMFSGAGFEQSPAEWRYPTTIFDLTDRKRAEEEGRKLLAISSSERMLRSVLSVLPVGVRVIDAAGHIQLQNQASREIFGDLVDMPLDRWTDYALNSTATGQPLPRERFPALRALERGETVMREEVQLAANDERPAKTLQLSAVPLRDQDGRIVGAVAVSEDVTQLKLAVLHLRQAKESAETANRVKDNFLAVVSHELRTPLTALLLWARMLRQGNLDPPTEARAIESIEQSANAQLRLVDDLLDVSRIVAGKLRLVAPTRLGDVVEAALASARPAAEEKRVQLIERLGGSSSSGNSGNSGNGRGGGRGGGRGNCATCIANLDGDRMRQVIANLLGNAIKFTPPGGWVRVTLRRLDGRARIEVTDNGRGIEPDFLPHVFDPFRQGDPATTRASGGLGLGLSIARQLVKLHGGTIGAHSAGPGKGATFFVEIPINSAATNAAASTDDATTTTTTAAATASSRSKRRSRSNTAAAMAAATNTSTTATNTTADPAPLTNLHILLVEDDAETRAAVQLFLTASGADVVAAASAQEGRERFVQQRPHIVVTDIAMPDESGYELLKSLRQLQRATGSQAPRIPIVALSAFASEDDRRRATQAGFDAHLAKPFDPPQFLRLLKRLTSHGRRRNTVTGSERQAKRAK